MKNCSVYRNGYMGLRSRYFSKIKQQANTHRIHVWYIYLHSVDFCGRCREICQSHGSVMGICKQVRFLLEYDSFGSTINFIFSWLREFLCLESGSPWIKKCHKEKDVHSMVTIDSGETYCAVERFFNDYLVTIPDAQFMVYLPTFGLEK